MVNRTFKRICPDIRLAKSRTAKDTTRITFDINSIPISKEYKAKGAPAGTNNENAWKPCSRNNIIVTPT